MLVTLSPAQAVAVGESLPTMGSGSIVFAQMLADERKRTDTLTAFVRDVRDGLRHRYVPGGHHHAECLVCRAEELLKVAR